MKVLAAFGSSVLSLLTKRLWQPRPLDDEGSTAAERVALLKSKHLPPETRLGYWHFIKAILIFAISYAMHLLLNNSYSTSFSDKCDINFFSVTKKLPELAFRCLCSCTSSLYRTRNIYYILIKCATLLIKILKSALISYSSFSWLRLLVFSIFIFKLKLKFWSVSFSLFKEVTNVKLRK